jgi:hypothetical protein
MLKDEIEKKIKKTTRVNPPNPRHGSCDGENPIKNKFNVKGLVTRVMKPINSHKK